MFFLQNRQQQSRLSADCRSPLRVTLAKLLCCGSIAVTIILMPQPSATADDQTNAAPQTSDSQSLATGNAVPLAKPSPKPKDVPADGKTADKTDAATVDVADTDSEPTAKPAESSSESPAEPTAEFLAKIEGISQYQLSNGVNVLLFPDPSKEVVTVNMTVFVGSRHEGYGEAGMAHLLEHMLFKGTPTHPEIPKLLKDRGARMNGTTWVDRTNYYETLPATDDNLKFAINLEADRLVNSYIRGEDLESEMTVVRNEFESGENSPIRILMQRVQSAAYDWHNYGKSTIGNRSDIERVPVIKLRRFYKKFYRPDNILVIVAGKFEPETALRYCEESFGQLTIPDTPIDQTYTTEPAQDGERTVVLRRGGDVQFAATAYHIPAGGHPDYAAAKALVYILGDEPSGRLYKQMVKQEIASNVYTLAFAFAEPGLFMSIAEVSADKSIETARQTLIDLMERSFEEEPITDVELERAKTQILKARELEANNTDQLAVSLSDWAAQGDWRLYFLYRDAVENLTVDDVNRVAKTYFRQTNRTVGLFIPSETTDRVTIPESPDITSVVQNYVGREEVSAGESFDPSPDVIESRTVRGQLIDGIDYALLPKKSRGEAVNLRLTLRFGTEQSLQGKVAAVEMLGILMNRGTDSLSYEALQDELNRLRTEMSISSTIGLLQVTIKTKREHLQRVSEILRDILHHPTLSPEELDVLKRQIVVGLQQSATEPQGVAPRFVRRQLSPFDKDHVWYVPTIDEEIEMYQGVTAEQIREVYETFIGLKDGEFTAVGDFEVETLVDQFKSALSGLTTDEPFKRVGRPANVGVAGVNETLQIDDKANAFYYASKQIDLSDTSEDYAPLVLGNYILGAGALSSRLGDRVRQQEGLSYTVRSVLASRSMDNRVDLTVYAITNPDNKDKLIDVIAEEMQILLDEGITDKELADAKDAFLQSARVSRTSDGQLAGELLSHLFLGRTMAFTEQFEQRIESATVEQVNESLRKHVDIDRLVGAIAGDFK